MIIPFLILPLLAHIYQALVKHSVPGYKKYNPALFNIELLNVVRSGKQRLVVNCYCRKCTINAR